MLVSGGRWYGHTGYSLVMLKTARLERSKSAVSLSLVKAQSSPRVTSNWGGVGSSKYALIALFELRSLACRVSDVSVQSIEGWLMISAYLQKSYCMLPRRACEVHKVRYSFL
jgi:hypothetical protein